MWRRAQRPPHENIGLATTPSDHVFEKRRVFPPCMKSVVVVENKEIRVRGRLCHILSILLCTSNKILSQKN